MFGVGHVDIKRLLSKFQKKVSFITKHLHFSSSYELYFGFWVVEGMEEVEI